MLSRPSAFEIFAIMLEFSKEKDCIKLEKLRNCGKKTSPTQGSEDLNKPDEGLLFKTVPEKSAVLYITEHIGTNVKVEIDLLSKKESPRKDVLIGAEGAEEVIISKLIKEYILPQYYKWKEIRDPDSKQYNLRAICEYLTQKSVVGVFEQPEVISLEWACSSEMEKWLRGVINEIIIRGHVKDDNLLPLK